MTDDTIQVCPHCDTNNKLRHRTGRYNNQPEGWWCADCNTFVNPVEREQRNKSVVGRGIASTLDDMDPDDL